MYCINCGAQLADTESRCPLCATEVFHPHLTRPEVSPLYPRDEMPPQQVRPWGAFLIVSILFLLPASICLVCDLQLNGSIRWSGYVIGGLGLLYTLCILPGWFSKPNPVIFVAVDFVAIALFLMYISIATQGGWFLSFGLPVTAGLGLIVTAVVTLTRYIRRGRLYIFGGAAIALGLFMLLLEQLLHTTFRISGSISWSLYPLIVFVLLGLTLLLIAVCKPLRESLERKFFF